MGRRSINTTKNGKLMNPTDQARKQARKRELKKNKRQRTLVRQAVLKSKDPSSIMNELKTLDAMEFDPLSQSPYNMKVVHEKRKKLKETWERLKHLYTRDDPNRIDELKAMEQDYERKKAELCAYYESVMQAQRVKIDEIPLPETPAHYILPQDIPLPETEEPDNTRMATATATAASIVASKPEMQLKKKPPGPPPGAPPELSDYDSDEDESDSRRKLSMNDISFEQADKIRLANMINNFQLPMVQPPFFATQVNRIYPVNNTQLTPTVVGSSVIEAKPQIRNKMANITKLVPTVLKVKRNEVPNRNDQYLRNIAAANSHKSTDAAYDAFMREIEGMLK